MSKELIERTQHWLTQAAFPLWLERGYDERNGGFFECLSMSGEPQFQSKRTMVQARQIYCCRLAIEMAGADAGRARTLIAKGRDFLLEKCSGSKGEFVHVVTAEGRVENPNPDLYAQAFALFGLAHAFAVLKEPFLKDRAKRLVDYLDLNRRFSEGGFSEMSGGGLRHEANPHMHLFEAAVTWMETDSDPRWRMLAEDVLKLCLEKFIDEKSGLLCEHFSPGWHRESRFVFEPGHHYEWAWLMGRYQQATGMNLRSVRKRLIDTAEEHGINRLRGAAWDEVWNDLTPKFRTSRFWPQCERIKAVVQMGVENRASEKNMAAAADEAMTSLFEFLNVPHPGLWFDTRLETGEFQVQPAKASSLYHIAGAMVEYLRHRPQISDRP